MVQGLELLIRLQSVEATTVREPQQLTQFDDISDTRGTVLTSL